MKVLDRLCIWDEEHRPRGRGGIESSKGSDERCSPYACVNLGEAGAPSQIKDRPSCIDADIDEVLASLEGMLPADGET